MDVEFAFLAQGIDIHDGGVDIRGFSRNLVQATAFPARVDHMEILIQFMGDRSECGQRHDLEAAVWERDGERLEPTWHTVLLFECGTGIHGDKVRMSQPLHTDNIVLPRPGEYEIHVLLDERRVWTIPFYAEPVES